MKTLILGAKGLLGTQLMKALPEAVGWDREDFNIEKITNYKLQITNLKPDCIINCVAYNDVDAAEQNGDQAFLLNAEAVGNLAKICKELEVSLVHFSTNYVFDGEKGEYGENDEPHPLSVYGQSKYEGERLLARNCRSYYLIRTAVLFGNRGSSPQAKKSFVQLMLDLSAKTKEIKAVNDEINSITSAIDLAGQVKLLLSQHLPYGIYHIVNSGAGSWYDYAREIFAVKQIKVDLQPAARREFSVAARRPKKAVLLNTKLPPLRSWQEALKEYLISNT